MNHDELTYALAKQLSSAHTLEGSYGAIDLDEELRAAVDAAVRPILERRLGISTHTSSRADHVRGATQMVPVELLNRIDDALGRFCGDEGWTADDMQTLDDLAATMLSATPIGDSAHAD
ncbi:hypothetical protein [Castellaniella sp.]|jgi:hypothetical protein|uniref:hypothetical protein n=1 Tax=Castellaniella sp. TaxID=1955812 RepID=UPI002AFE9390|nr:hypothetical protein [Castellaniella sp.]